MTAPGTNSGFEVDLTALAAHQQQLGAVMDQLGEALRAALEAHLPQEAFGPFGGPLAAAIEPTAAAAREAFERAVESVRADQDGIKHTVHEYDNTDRSRARVLHSLNEVVVE